MSFDYIFDLVIIAFVLILGIKGILNGLIREIFGLIGIIGGIIVATRFGFETGDLISHKIYHIDGKEVIYFVGFLSVLICFWLASLILGKLLSKLVGMSGLGFLDRLGGFFIGSAKIFFVVCILLSVISNITVLNNKISPYFKGSIVYPICISTGQWILNIKPNTIKKDLDNKLNTITNDITKASESNISQQLLEQNGTK